MAQQKRKKKTSSPPGGRPPASAPTAPPTVDKVVVATKEPLQVEVSETAPASQRRFKSWLKSGWGKFFAATLIIVPFATVFSAVYPVLNDGPPTTTNTTNNYNNTTIDDALPGQAPGFNNQEASCPPALGNAPELTEYGTVQVFTKISGARESSCWDTEIGVPRIPSFVTVMIAWENSSQDVQNDMIVRFNLPPYTDLQPNTTQVYNSLYPDGRAVSDDSILAGGVIVGDYAPGANFYVTFDLVMPGPDQLKCGTTKLTGVGSAHPTGTPEFYNTVIWNVTRNCD